jgi:hypothetical protein
MKAAHSVTDPTIAQAVSRRFPIKAVQVRSQLRPFGLCGGMFFRLLQFPLPILIPPAALCSFMNQPSGSSGGQSAGGA